MSVSGSAPMTTPAAWMPSWRTSPSSGFARSTISRATGSLSYAALSSWPALRHASRLWPGPSGIRFATRPDGDPVPLRERDEVPDDQEVVGEAHLADRLQLEAEAILELGRDRLVAPLEALLAELDEVVERVASLGRRELRQQDPAELEGHVAALGDLERSPQRFLVAREVGRHLGRGLEVELVGLEAPVVRVLERVARLDAEQGLVRACVVVHQVVDVAGRDERQARLAGQLHELRVDALLHLEARVLQL